MADFKTKGSSNSVSCIPLGKSIPQAQQSKGIILVTHTKKRFFNHYAQV